LRTYNPAMKQQQGTDEIFLETKQSYYGERLQNVLTREERGKITLLHRLDMVWCERGAGCEDVEAIVQGAKEIQNSGHGLSQLRQLSFCMGRLETCRQLFVGRPLHTQPFPLRPMRGIQGFPHARFNNCTPEGAVMMLLRHSNHRS
jgi:hypothetical protein